MRMRVKFSVVKSTLLGFSMTLFAGCADTANPPVANVPPLKAEESKPAPKTASKTVGGVGSSGGMNKNPGASD